MRGLLYMFATVALAVPAGAAAGDDDPSEPKPAKLELTVLGGRDADPGESVRYRFRVRNSGGAPAYAVRVRVPLPRQLVHRRGGTPSDDGRTVTFSYGRLTAGRTASRVLVARVKRTADPAAKIRVTARATGQARKPSAQPARP